MIIPPDELTSSLGGGVFLMDLLRPATPPGPSDHTGPTAGFHSRRVEVSGSSRAATPPGFRVQIPPRSPSWYQWFYKSTLIIVGEFADHSGVPSVSRTSWCWTGLSWVQRKAVKLYWSIDSSLDPDQSQEDSRLTPSDRRVTCLDSSLMTKYQHDDIKVLDYKKSSAFKMSLN